MTKFIEIPANKMSLSRRKLTFGIGVNDAPYIVSSRIDKKNKLCPYYQAWTSMLKRCYDSKLHLKSPTYIGCSVTKEWLVFSNFRLWMESQDWYGMELDKDIKIVGNKFYSPETCLFVSRKINSLITGLNLASGKYPAGVCFDKCANVFISRCYHNGKIKHLGLFSTPKAARESYATYKRQIILEVANLPENSHIRSYLINHAESLV